MRSPKLSLLASACYALVGAMRLLGWKDHHSASNRWVAAVWFLVAALWALIAWTGWRRRRVA